MGLADGAAWEAEHGAPPARAASTVPRDFDPTSALVVMRQFKSESPLTPRSLPDSYKIQTIAQVHGVTDQELAGDVAAHGRAHHWRDASDGRDAAINPHWAIGAAAVIQYGSARARDAALASLGALAEGGSGAAGQAGLDKAMASLKGQRGMKILSSQDLGTAMAKPLALRESKSEPAPEPSKETAMSEQQDSKADDAKRTSQIFLTATKREVELALKRPSEALQGDPTPVVKALVAFGQSIEQDQWAKDGRGAFQRTGEVKVGTDALRALKDDFGPELYRNVTLNAARATDSANLVPDGVKVLDDAVKRSEARRAAAARQKTAERTLDAKIPVIVTIDEVRDAISAVKNGSKTVTKTAEVLSKLANSIEQPQWAKGKDGKPVDTGEFKTGLPALEGLRDGFGSGKFRKVTLSAVKAEHGLSIVGNALSATFKEVQDLSAARDAEHKANRQASAQRPARESAGAGR